MLLASLTKAGASDGEGFDYNTPSADYWLVEIAAFETGLSADMLRSMAERPVVFTCSNPDPEIIFLDKMAEQAQPIEDKGIARYEQNLEKAKVEKVVGPEGIKGKFSMSEDF